jgi:hypothetical protein
MRKLGIALLWLALGMASWDATWVRLFETQYGITQQSSASDGSGVSAQDDGTGIPNH